MSTQVYTAVREHCHALLRQQYQHVATPIEGPGKADYGDVDVVVACPHNACDTLRGAFEAVKRLLGAVRMIHEGGKSLSANFAIPWLEGTSVIEEHKVPPDPLFIQVDVQICPSVDKFRWMLFKHGHGDMWNLLGVIVRPYGLTIDDDAMWLRVPEIEKTNKKRAKVFLSSEPDTVLRFLGLPVEPFWSRPFGGAEELYEYVAECRMFQPEQVKPATNSNDRRRANTRPTVQKWIEDFIPRCQSAGKFRHAAVTREEITAEAIACFGVRDEYGARRRDYLIEQQKNHVWVNMIKAAIPAPAASDNLGTLYRNILVKTLRRVIIEDDDSYGVAPGDELKDDEGLWVDKKVKYFIDTHKDRIGQAAYARHNELYQNGRKKEAQGNAST
jgi:hypothetical protein